MAIGREHELHRRRFGRNLGVGLALGAFVVLLFALSVVKIKSGATVDDFDHRLRPGMVAGGN